jgi:glycosyltransferase involved in cell wall biosynthesis
MEHDTPLLGMVGRFDPQKDHENLLRALDQLKQAGTLFRCVLVGRGLDATNDQLTAWLEQYGFQDDVLLLGQRSDVPAVMSALDLHVLSSAYGEAFPNVLAEAMACGTPCVTTDVGDAAAIVGDTGWVAPPADTARLAEAIEAALAVRDDSSVWQARREAARTRVAERFSLEKMVAAYHAVWGGNEG